MENMFVWVVIFAGAAIALLGLFLVASERELKNKRLEIDKLVAKLGGSPAEQRPAPLLLTQEVESEEASELRAKNEEFQKEIANLSAKLELSRKAVEELETAAQQDRNSEADAQQLRAANEALRSEIKEIQEHLQTSGARITESAAKNLDAVEHQRQLQSEISELQTQLAESRIKVRELESSQQKLANAESMEAIHADERRQLETKIADLERNLASARETPRESNSLRERLAETERLRQELDEENRRYEEEIPRWQARIAEADENRRRLSGLHAPYDALLAKHAELAERHNQFEEDLAAFGGLVALPFGASVETNGPENSMRNQTRVSTAMAAANPATAASLSAIRLANGTASHSDAEINSDQASAGAPERLSPAGPSNKKRQRRFGVFPLVLAVAALGTLALVMWHTPAEEPGIHPAKDSASPSRKTERQPNKAVAGANAPAPKAESVPIQLAARSKEPPTPADKESGARAKPLQAARLETKVSGTYQITQLSRVYAAPNEFSRLIGDVEPGVRVNVVNARDGWLEIHSKHGRPPGFIRKEAAAKVSG